METKTLVIIIGPQAVGKMTVGQELGRVTGYKLLYNHQTIDLLDPIFGFGTPSFLRLSLEFRRAIFEEVAASDLPGFIFTNAWNLDNAAHSMQMASYCEPFERRDAKVCFVELASPLQTRLARNRTENRLAYKPQKADFARSEKLILDAEIRRYNSDGNFPYPDRHLKIENDNLSPQEVVAQICSHFGLEKAVMVTPSSASPPSVAIETPF